MTGNFQIGRVCGDLNGIHRLASQAIGGAEDLHRANQVKLLDLRNDDYGHVVPFKKAFARDIAP